MTNLIEQKISSEYRTQAVDAIKNLASLLRTNYLWLLLVMFKESRLNPLAVNPITKARGLIQFMPSTLKEIESKMGRSMPNNFLGQLPFVHEYFKRFTGKLNSYYDVYFAVFYPVAIGKPDDFILGISRGDAYAKLLTRQNKPLDIDKNGYVTVSEAKKWFKIGVTDYMKAIITNPHYILGFIISAAAAFFLR